MNKTFFIPANIGEFSYFEIIMMKRLILIILAAAITAGARSQDSLSISLLTCSQGRDVSSAFGHSALRVKDYNNGRDFVFNYGTFSFEEPHFFSGSSRETSTISCQSTHSMHSSDHTMLSAAV